MIMIHQVIVAGLALTTRQTQATAARQAQVGIGWAIRYLNPATLAIARVTHFVLF
jgi:hypothetical protein